ncbi:MAG TPA: hypothetical protein VFR57_12085, partial [Burkholderiales bacterium]|nr:hypothetical protein [Burkholderiales bacterium]
MHTVFLGKPVHAAVAMRFNATGEIARYAYVQRPVWFAGEDVDHGLLHFATNALTRAVVDLKKLGPRLRGDDYRRFFEVSLGRLFRPERDHMVDVEPD